MACCRVIGDFLILLWDILVVTSVLTVLTIWHVITFFIPRWKKPLDNEIVLITGAGQGIGKEIARICAKLKATVVLWDTNEKSVSGVASDIRAEGGRATSYVCDVTNENEVNLTAARIREEIGDVTILINNAGILQNLPFLKLESTRIRSTFEVNAISHFWTIRAFLPRMLELNRGHIVGISSIAGLIATVNFSDYSASKFAVVGMMKSLADEVRMSKKKVHFTTICPVMVGTGMIQHTKLKHRFLMPVLDPQKTASDIVTAIRKEKVLVTLPAHMKLVYLLFRILPDRAVNVVLDYMDYCRIPNKEIALNSVQIV